MQHWTDTAILLSLHRHGESSAIARMFTQQHGLHGGMAKGAFGKRQRGIYIPGNLLRVEWRARLSEHLGYWQTELDTPYAAMLMQQPSYLLNWWQLISQYVLDTMAEGDPHPALYQQMLELLETVAPSRNVTHHQCATLLIRFEGALLRELGFELDLSHCAATGQEHDLQYISPKTGRAVSREAGEPYRDKLLPLPSLMRHLDGDHHTDSVPTAPDDADDLRQALHITGYFLEKWPYAMLHKPLPAMRERCLGQLLTLNDPMPA